MIEETVKIVLFLFCCAVIMLFLAYSVAFFYRALGFLIFKGYEHAKKIMPIDEETR